MALINSVHEIIHTALYGGVLTEDALCSSPTSASCRQQGSHHL
jgi:hypothetical protein